MIPCVVFVHVKMKNINDPSLCLQFRYWPNEEETTKYDDIQVKCLSREVITNAVTERRLTLSKAWCLFYTVINECPNAMLAYVWRLCLLLPL